MRMSIDTIQVFDSLYMKLNNCSGKGRTYYSPAHKWPKGGEIALVSQLTAELGEKSWKPQSTHNSSKEVVSCTGALMSSKDAQIARDCSLHLGTNREHYKIGLQRGFYQTTSTSCSGAISQGTGRSLHPYHAAPGI